MPSQDDKTQLTALVTGGAGFIGSHVVQMLLSEGYRVVVVDDFSTLTYPDRRKRLNMLTVINRDRGRGNVLFVASSVLDVDACLRYLSDQGVHGVKLVVHCAGFPSAPACESYQGLAYVVNVEGTQHALRLSMALGASQFIHLSSSSVYTHSKPGPVSEHDVDICTVRPLSYYGATKAQSEVVCHRGPHPPSLVILRPFTVYGPRQRDDMLLQSWLTYFLSGKKVRLRGGFSVSRDFTFVGDFVDAVRRCAALEGAPPLTLNVGSGTPASLGDVYNELCRRFNYGPGYELGPLLPVEPKSTHADSSRLQRLTGWRPRYSLRDGVIEFLNDELPYRTSTIEPNITKKLFRW